MRYLGLDLGTKTLGMAMSDKLGIIASSYGTIRFENEDYEPSDTVQNISNEIAYRTGIS